MVGLLRHFVNLSFLAVDLSLGQAQVRMELIDFVEASNLSLLIVHDIFLFFLNVVDRCLNLGCQILHKYIEVIFLMLFLNPAHRLLFLLEYVDLHSRQLGLRAATKQEREVLGVYRALRLHTKHACRDGASIFGGLGGCVH